MAVQIKYIVCHFETTSFVRKLNERTRLSSNVPLTFAVFQFKDDLICIIGATNELY